MWPILGDLLKKVTHLGGTPPYTTYTEVGPPPLGFDMEADSTL